MAKAVQQKKYKQLSPEEEKQILADYKKGVLRSEIIYKYEISEYQFVSIVKINSAKQNEIIAHPKHFKFSN